MPISTYFWPGKTHVGFGAAGLVGQEAQAMGANHVFVLVDPGVKAVGLLDPLIASLQQAGEPAYTVCDRVVPNPDAEAVDAVAAIFRESEADLILALGGGSGLDMAKGVRLLAGGPPEARIIEYTALRSQQPRPLPQPCQMPPMFAIPTTAGTGSEVTPWGVITDTERKLKAGVGGTVLIPTAAFIDPELTLELPQFLTAATGLDALSHCIEAYVSTNDNPVLDTMILHGIELIGRSLRVAVAQGKNRPARRDMMLAAMIGGIGISSKWLGACHSLAHQLSSFADVHHGVAIALMLPHQMQYGLIGAMDRYEAIGRALDGKNRAKGSSRKRAERAVKMVRELIEDIGLPTHLEEVGITEDMIPAMAHNAYLDLNWSTNPRTMSQAEMEKIYRQAL